MVKALGTALLSGTGVVRASANSVDVRTHACPSCGLVIDRDYNASLNILRAGIGAGALNVIGCR
jgi:transposase